MMQDYYDQDMKTEYKCPICGCIIISHPDCSLSCSKCEFKSKTNWPGMEAVSHVFDLRQGENDTY